MPNLSDRCVFFRLAEAYQVAIPPSTAPAHLMINSDWVGLSIGRFGRKPPRPRGTGLHQQPGGTGNPLIINDIAAAIRTLSSKSLYLPEITWYRGAIAPFFRLAKPSNAILPFAAGIIT